MNESGEETRIGAEGEEETVPFVRSDEEEEYRRR